MRARCRSTPRHQGGSPCHLAGAYSTAYPWRRRGPRRARARCARRLVPRESLAQPLLRLAFEVLSASPARFATGGSRGSPPRPASGRFPWRVPEVRSRGVRAEPQRTPSSESVGCWATLRKVSLSFVPCCCRKRSGGSAKACSRRSLIQTVAVAEVRGAPRSVPRRGKPQRNEPRGASLRSPRPARTLRTPREHGRSRDAPCKILANCEEIALPSRVRDGSGLGRRR